MQPDHLVTFGTMLALVWSFGAVLALIRHNKSPTKLQVVHAVASLSMLMGALWLNSMVSLGRNGFVFITNVLAKGDLQHLCAAGLGACLGIVPALWPWQLVDRAPSEQKSGRWVPIIGLLSMLMAFCFLSMIALQEQIKPYVARRSLASIIANPFGYTQQDDFAMDEIHECDFYPVQIEVGPDGNLYATGYSGAAFQRGVVARLTQDKQTGMIAETRIAQSLSRPHGLAFHNGDLYVSRCGQYAKADHGTLTYMDTGAITLLRDLDGDGIMDYYDDVVTGLPGGQGPDPLHQNNGIAFSSDGYLYITVGMPADRAPTIGEYAGTILRAHADGSDMTVVARGMRNPFDITLGPGGQVFCTDNDASDRRNGDELNHVIQGGHYGYPYADGSNPHPDGTVSPLGIIKDGTYQGITYANSPKLPEKYRDCLYIASYGNGEIYRVKLTPRGETYEANISLFARVPGALDITVDDDGVFYVSCFHTKKIYRLKHQENGA